LVQQDCADLQNNGRLIQNEQTDDRARKRAGVRRAPVRKMPAAVRINVGFMCGDEEMSRKTAFSALNFYWTTKKHDFVGVNSLGFHSQKLKGIAANPVFFLLFVDSNAAWSRCKLPKIA